MRPITITPEMHDELMEKFSSHLKNLMMTSNSFSFSQSIMDVKNKDKVFITFTMKAYIKMRDLIDRYNSEVGWFGFIDKISDLEYQITDICVYPQLVTGTTVKETNESWDDDMPIEQIKRRHFHGHSHVNMAPTPSGTDMKHRDDQLALVNKNSFWLFMITNKQCAWTAALFDLANNVVYNTDDILIDVDLGDGEMLSDFVDESAKRIKTQTAAALKSMMDARNNADHVPIMTTSNAYSGQNVWLPKPKGSQVTESKKAQKPKEKVSPVAQEQVDMFQGLNDDDFDEELENYAAAQDDYYDDILGHVSDSPHVCSDFILSHMRS